MNEFVTQAPARTERCKPDGNNGLIIAWAAYILMVLGAGLISLIICYVGRGSKDIRGTYLESHMTWLIRTFWWSVLWFIVSLALAYFVVGFVIMIVWGIWVIYRVVLGIIRLIGHTEVD